MNNPQDVINILIIDDHPLVAAGVASMLLPEDGIAIGGSARILAQGLDMLQQGNYQMVLLDINLPDTDGIEGCALIRKALPDVKILGLTSGNEPAIIARFLSEGGNGYLLKNMEREQLLEAIDRVLAGKIYLSAEANEALLQQYSSMHTAIKSVPALTRREKELLQLLAEGLNGPQIAEKLFLSPHTVESHRKNLMQKFGVSNTQALLHQARKCSMLK